MADTVADQMVKLLAAADVQRIYGIATAGILFDGDEGRLSEEAFLRDFAGDLPDAKAKVL
jgi:hypothetical protein